jgi:hypothetical protein
VKETKLKRETKKRREHNSEKGKQKREKKP